MRMLPTSLLCAFLVLAVVAAEKPVRDFSAGFEKLCKLAQIPDLTEAEPGCIERLQWTRVGHWSRALSYGVAEGAASSWKLGENPDGSLRILLDGWMVVPLYPLSEKDPTRLRGRWRRAAAREIESVLVGTAANWEWRCRREPGKEAEAKERKGGGLLFGATFLYAAGKHRQANEIATHLLGLDNARLVLAQAYQAAANRAYHGAFMAFITSNDREAFRQALAGIASRFPAGWDRLPVVERMQQAIRDPGDPPDTEAMRALTKEDRELLAELTRPGPCEVLPEMREWLFMVPPDLVYAQHNTALRRLLQKGTDALPLIFALAEDRRPTRYLELGFGPNRAAALPERSLGDALYPAGSFALKVDFVREMRSVDGAGPHMGLPHLLTGTELAGALLEGAWNGAGKMEPEDPEFQESLSTLREWHTSGGADRVSLTRKMLESPDLRASGVAYLLAGPPGEEDYPAIEEAILKLNGIAMCGALTWLVELRGEKARPVHARAVARSRKTDRNGLPEYMVTRIMATAEQEAVWAQLRTAIAEIRDPIKLDEARQEMTMQIYGWCRGNEALAGELLAAAANSQDRIRRKVLFYLLQTVLEIPWHVPERPPFCRLRWEQLAAYRLANPTVPPRHLSQTAWIMAGSVVLDRERYGPSWRKLIPSRPPPAVRSALLPHDRADWAIYSEFLRMYDPEGYRRTIGRVEGAERDTGGLELLPGGIERQLWKFAQALLARPRAPLPSLPDATRVKPERLAEITAGVAGLAPEQTQRKVMSLPAGELLAFMELVHSDEALKQRLLPPLRRQFPSTCRCVGKVPQPVRQFVAGLAGERFSSKLAERMIRETKELVARGHCFAVAFESENGMRTQLTARSLEPAPTDGWEAEQMLSDIGMGGREGKAVTSGVGVWLLTSHLNPSAHWPLRDNDERVPDRGKRPGDLDATLGQRTRDPTAKRDHLMKALDNFPEEELMQLHGQIRFGIVGINQETWNRLQPEAAK